MKYCIFPLLFFLLSCASARKQRHQFAHELDNYNLSNGDTLVDIGSGYGLVERELSHRNPTLHFILEDIPKNIWTDDVKGVLTKEVVNSKYAPTLGSNSTIVIGREDSIPLPSGRYNNVLCRISMHEFTQKEKMVSELTRILSDTGTLLIVERVAQYEGHIEKACKKLLLTKEEVISSFEHLQLVDSILLYDKDTYIFKFKKLPSVN